MIGLGIETTPSRSLALENEMSADSTVLITLQMVEEEFDGENEAETEWKSLREEEFEETWRKERFEGLL